MTTDTDTSAMRELDREMTKWAALPMGNDTFDGMNLGQLGNLHRALRLALAEVEEALAPKIVAGSKRGLTYVELASASGYGSTTTITKIMREQGVSPGRGRKPFRY
jgi:hypothetical protein